MERDDKENGPIVDFPVETYIDKSECQQPEFIKKYKADGRGTIIAILDTGVDPSLKSLNETSVGHRKILDLIDCSGAGDVDTSTVKKASQERELIGLTGRTLKIPEGWQNPTNKWHIGIKPIYELYPKSLRKIVKDEWQKLTWDSAHQLAKSDALRLLQKHEESVGGFSDDVKDKHERENLASKLEFLKSMDKLEDKGPVADCIVWNNGEIWQACIDTSFRGRLKLCKALGDFRYTSNYAKISDRDEASYSVRIENAGNRLEICLASGAHGSHVACIAAAYEESRPNTSGLAPGAQIISMMIGDNRIDSMETGTAIIRALNICADIGVDVVNMSFGEGSHFPASGRIIEEIQRLVYQHNVVFVSSAGNSGPALSTVGSPGGTTPGVIGVGAHISAKQAEPLYGVHDDVMDYSYPWSARGPCTDGSLGVSLCAVGAAFAEVPRYCRKSRQVMNGTSMSSPNVAGAVACLLSKLRADNIEWSAFLVRLALENTAKKEFCEARDLFATGNGVIQVVLLVFL
ncbi:peptidase, S8/S53 family [Oesophagostomum dentatum]|uniref:Peptidase, S8/S53 family n=1 Tax=Oesophagostomum dentatum TaxID=61180 RepID=A0A0B1TW15_OESDE|nr:peptidase, S8/S53 family [Oesophagostomum dentatum]